MRISHRIFAAATLSLFLVLLAGCTVSGKGEPTEPLESASFVPLIGSEQRSFFGDAVAIDGDTLAVGAWGSGRSAGSVRVYERAESGWEEVELNRPPAVQEGDRFGQSVALVGDELIAGAPHSKAVGSNAWDGAVYYYRRVGGEWRLEQQLAPETTSADAQFGGAVALAGGVLAVVSAGVGQQTLHLYEKSAAGWTLEQSFELDPEGVGHRVAMDDDIVAVGARVAGDPAERGSPGVLRLFERIDGAWAEIPAPAGAEAAGCFGCSVAVAGDLLAVGAPAPAEGAAFVYRRNGEGWQQMSRLARKEVGSAHFGEAVALSGDRLLVGAPGDDTAGENVGRLFVYLLDGGDWALEAELSPDDLPEMSGFASTLAADSANVAAGAPGVEEARGSVLISPLGGLEQSLE